MLKGTRWNERRPIFPSRTQYFFSFFPPPLRFSPQGAPASKSVGRISPLLLFEKADFCPWPPRAQKIGPRETSLLAPSLPMGKSLLSFWPCPDLLSSSATEKQLSVYIGFFRVTAPIIIIIQKTTVQALQSGKRFKKRGTSRKMCVVKGGWWST